MTAWPVTLVEGRVGLRPLRVRDAHAWSELRLRNEQWLARWEGRAPGQSQLSWAERHSTTAFSAMLRVLRREARAGRCLPFAVTYDGSLAGQLTLSPIVRGAMQSAAAGYWVDERVAGHGVMPQALAMAVDHCFGAVGLHRVEANIRPENRPSLRVVEKLGFREEGVHQRLLYIDGAWCDHRCFAVTVEDVPEGLLRRWREAQSLDAQGE